MSHYEERLQADLEAIRRRVRAIGEQVQAAQQQAVRALLTTDRALAAEVILGDLPINRQVRALDQACHAFVARHVPSAGPLRFVSSVLRLSIGLERIGDYAATICREAVQLSAPIPPVIADQVELMADQSYAALAQAMTAWNTGNAELARGTLGMAKQAGGAFDTLIKALVRQGTEGVQPLADLFASLTVLTRLSRVVGQAKNICEETLFAVAGETKEPKRYRLLFVDAQDNCFSQLAVAYCRRAFPESADYESAGWEPGGALEARCQVFMERHGFATNGLSPKGLRELSDDLSAYHLIISLAGDIRPHVEEIPFHTVVLEWNLGPPVEGLDQQRAEHVLQAAWDELKVRCGGLMELLRGEGAS